MEKQTLTTVTTVLAKGDEPSITISTIGIDRECDEIVPEGGDFSAYLKNPVVLYGHDYSGLPVGTTTKLDVLPGRGIRASWRWLEGDEFAARVRNAFDQGVLRAASIGFLPLDYEKNDSGGRRYTKWQALEWSLTPVPANPECVRTLKRLDLWPRDNDVALYLRDEDDSVVLTLTGDADERALFDPNDLTAALREALVAMRAELVRGVSDEVVREVARRRGRVDDTDLDPVNDSRARHRTVRAGEFL